MVLSNHVFSSLGLPSSCKEGVLVLDSGERSFSALCVAIGLKISALLASEGRSVCPITWSLGKAEGPKERCLPGKQVRRAGGQKAMRVKRNLTAIGLDL